MSSKHPTHTNSLHCEFHNSSFSGPAGFYRFCYKIYSEKNVDNSADKVLLTQQLFLECSYDEIIIVLISNFSSLHISFLEYFLYHPFPSHVA